MKLWRQTRLRDSVLLLLALMLVERLLLPGILTWKLMGLPYWAVALYLGSSFGRRDFLIGSIISLTVLHLSLLLELLGLGPRFYTEAMPPINFYATTIVLPSLLWFILGLGLAFRIDSLKASIRQLHQRLRQVSGENHRVGTSNKHLLQITEALSNRISKDKEALILIHKHLNTLNSLDLAKGIEALIDILITITAVEGVRVYRYNSNSQSLELFSAAGSGGIVRAGAATQHEQLEIRSSLEGWVYRNRALYSLRMVNDNPLLKKLDNGRTILAYPLVLNRRTWGVLSIDELPFHAYSEHTELMLDIILKLASPKLSEAEEYLQIIEEEEFDPITGLAYYSAFRKALDREFEGAQTRDSSLSIIIIEFVEVEDILKIGGSELFRSCLKEQMHAGLIPNQLKAFTYHFREFYQIAVIAPHTDEDAVSRMALEILGTLAGSTWKLGETSLPIEVRIGHASKSHEVHDSSALLASAEHLLELQRI